MIKSKKSVAIIIVFAMILSILLPVSKFAFQSVTTSIKISFRDNYNSEQGYVQYSINDGASWINVTENINENSISMQGDNLRIRIVPNDGYSVDFAGMTYREDGENPKSLNEQENSSIAGGLTSQNGYFVSSTATSVEIEQVEFRAEGGQFDPGNPR